MARHTVYFATNRQPEMKGKNVVGFLDEVGPIGGTALRFGRIEVDVANGLEDDAAIVDGSLFVAPEDLTPSKGAKKVGSRPMFDEIRSILRNPQDDHNCVIAFVHGFNNGWEDSMKRAGVIADLYANLGRDGKALVFAFSWPAAGGGPVPVITYDHDRRAAAKSGIAGARALIIMRDYVRSLMEEARKGDPRNIRAALCERRFHLMVHSMGHQVMSHVMEALPLLTSSGVGRVFDEVVLAAADEDARALDARIAANPTQAGSLYPLTALAKRISVYSNQDDWVLHTLSEGTKNAERRLGVNGPATVPYAANVYNVDCTQVVTSDHDWQQHQYYRRIQRVRDDILQVLQGVPQDAIAGRKEVSPQRYRLG